MKLNKDLERTITWRKKYRKRLLCKHNFKWFAIKSTDGDKSELGYLICTKCGELK